MNEDGRKIDWDNLYDYFSATSDKTTASLKVLADKIVALSDSLYDANYLVEDDGKDRPFPPSPDSKRTDVEYYWDRALREAAENSKKFPTGWSIPPESTIW